MNEIKIYPPRTLGTYDYVVMLSRYHDKFMLSRHKNRTTWEMQGGHIEPGETPEAAAKRELFEESGAISFNLIPLCDYCGEEPGKNNHGAGMVFCADIHELGIMPESEMAETALFNRFPDNLTYPEITRCIYNAYKTL